MNIYELEKQATPGPWAKERHTLDGVDVPHLDGPMGSCCVSVGGNCNVPITQRSENALLIAHCRNNFMTALEALKNEVAIRFHDEDAKFYDKESLKILIKELEEVK